MLSQFFIGKKKKKKKVFMLSPLRSFKGIYEY